MDSQAMEQSLINFLRSDIKPIDLGDIFEGENFPILGPKTAKIPKAKPPAIA